MENEKKANNDLQYCYTALDLLEELEKKVYERNELRRQFEEKTQARRNLIIGLCSLVLPAIIWLRLFFSPDGILHQQELGNEFSDFFTRLLSLGTVTVFLFLAGYFFGLFLWDGKMLLPFRNKVEKKFKQEMDVAVERINQGNEEILSQPVFQENRIPQKYLCIEMISILVRYFESHQASFLEMAVYMLDLDMKNSPHYRNILPAFTLCEKEKNYLENYEEEKYIEQIKDKYQKT